MTALPDIKLEIIAATAAYPKAARDKFSEIRAVIFEMAYDEPRVGPLTETLKWGEPAYLTETSKSGSTIRVAWKPNAPDHIAIYLNCQTTLVETMRLNYPDVFTYEGNRAVLIALNRPIPIEPLQRCVALAQSYHLNKSKRPI